MTQLDQHGPGDVPFEPFDEEWVGQGIIARFLVTARRHRDHPAIIDSNGSLSYAAIASAMGRLAGRITSAAPQSGAIGILLPQSADFWIAILACLATGRPYVALDLHHPAARNMEILHAAGLAAVIAPADFDPAAEVIPPALHRIIWPADGADGASNLEDDAPFTLPAPASDRPAIILYTSGSTGRPKGIANSEAALLQRVAQYVNACHLHAGDRFLTLSSPCTIAGTREGMTALLIGATLHVVDAQRRGFGDIAERIRAASVTIFNSVPSVLRALVIAQPDAADALESLRVVRIGGEVLFWSDLRLFRRVLPADCHIQIGYSSTESTGTQWFVPADATPNGPFVPVGYVLPGNVASILDESGHMVSPGDVGELVLRSRFIALGLWEDGHCIARDVRQEDDPAVRVLHTGDLAHIDANGLCTIVGRKDRQVKINGTRVEPAEVEAALRDLAEVRDAAVITRRSGKTVTLAAFVAPAQATPQTVPRIRAALRTSLPASMRPARIQLVSSIPQLPSGKLDIRALEVLDRQADAAPDDDREADDREIRRSVYRAWRSVLGRRSLLERSSFEDAGGDSLKLLQLVLSLETQLGHRLPLDLFDGDMQPEDLVHILQSLQETATARDDRRPTIFLLPGLDGDEPRLAMFRTALSERLHFALVDYPDWPQMVRDGNSFAVLVECAVSQIIAAAPSGELLLAGYSFGGDVAFAVASRLVGMGRGIGFLGILDTDLRRVADDAEQFRKGRPLPRGRQIMLEVAHDRFNTGLGFMLAKGARDLVGLERMLRASRAWRPLLSRRTEFAFDRRIRTILRLQAQWRWHLDEVTPPIDVPTVLFRSRGHAADATPDLGWRARCPGLSVVQVEGDHRSMLDLPHRTALCHRFADAVSLQAGESGVFAAASVVT